MKVKTLLSFVVLTAVLASCNPPAGELVGTGRNSNFREANPVGMRYIKPGSFLMSSNSESALYTQKDNPIQVTVSGFWMDETEITNDEYKQFVNWVRDSIVYTILIEQLDMTDYALVAKNKEFDPENYRIDWRKKIPWGEIMLATEDDDLYAVREALFLSSGKINDHKLYYHYSWMNYDEASKPQNRFDVARGRYPENAQVRVDSAWIDPETHFIHDTTIIRPLRTPDDLITSMIIGIHPDTLIWNQDFRISYNDPMVQSYFSNPSYINYPVVGVTWEQADAFCHWRTAYFLGSSTQLIQSYRLPTEAEWEYAARGGRRLAKYPWGNGYTRDSQGCFLANFKPYSGSYTDDTGDATKAVASYSPNDFGLFDMAGNVAEWTSSAFSATANTQIHDMNPSLQYRARKSDPDELKRKVIKGGSWKDIAYYLECGTRTYEYQYESRPYIGFRCVRSRLGE